MFIAVRTGLEPATPCVTGMYSNQLNYRTIDSCLFQLASAKIEHNFEFAKFFRIFFCRRGRKNAEKCSFWALFVPFSVRMWPVSPADGRCGASLPPSYLNSKYGSWLH